MPRDLPTSLWTAALLQRARAGGAFATIVHKGDEARGDVLIKVTRARGFAAVYAPAFAPEGPAMFERLPQGVSDPTEAEADALIDKRLKFDRDLWVIEIEDRAGRHFLTERIKPDA